jgi:hypothetical protein
MSTPQHSGELRGSQKLLAKLPKNEEQISPREIIEAFKLPASAKIPFWLNKGTPAHYLTMEGVVEVPVSDLSAVVEKFVALNDSAIGLKILTNGIPIPDIAQVIVTNIRVQE